MTAQWKISLGMLMLLVWLASAMTGHSLAWEWPRSSPEEQGLDGAVIRGYVGAIAAGEYGSIHSLLIVRHGRLVTEEYFGYWGADSLHPVFSVTKSVTSALLGILHEQAYWTDLDSRLLDYFPEYDDLANMSPAKRAITLRDVLTMTAGFQWNELSLDYSNPFNDVVLMSLSADWLRYVLDKPMTDNPGDKFNYNSGCTMLLGGIIHQTTGWEARHLVSPLLFDFVDIDAYEWSTGAQGITNTGWGLSLRPLDMASFGYLYLHNGARRGMSVVPAEWVYDSLSDQVAAREGSHYGYQWWVLPLDPAAPDAPARIRTAWGYGGQFIFVVPTLDMVVVSTAGEYNSIQNGAVDFIQHLLAEAVLDPAAASGDVDDDGFVTAADLALLRRSCAEQPALPVTPADAVARGDRNGDGRLDIIDCLQVQIWLRADD
ncbi:MAG: serine hydrolase [Acidobacteria bacterium]|nr:serine hydrolase [Acidobacteriota bacterium]